MAGRFSDKWKDRILWLFETEGINGAREASALTVDPQTGKAAVSAAYINDWKGKGRVPEYDMAYAFLQHFPRHRIECMAEAGYPVPPEWLAEDPMSAVRQSICSMIPYLRDGEVNDIMEFIEEVVKKVPSARKKRAANAKR